MIDTAAIERVRETLVGKKLLLLARGTGGGLGVEVVGTPSKWVGGELPTLIVERVERIDDLPDAKACLEICFESGHSLEFFVLGDPHADHRGWENWISVLFCDKESVPSQNGVLVQTSDMQRGEFCEFLFDDGSKIMVERKWTQGLDLSWVIELFVILRPSGGGSVELMRTEE